MSELVINNTWTDDENDTTRHTRRKLILRYLSFLAG